MRKKILIIVNSTKISGAEISLLSLLEGLNKEKYSIIIVLPNGELFDLLKSKYDLRSIKLKRYSGKNPPIRSLTFFYYLLVSSMKICDIIYKEKIDVVYANSYQAQIYAAIVKSITGKKTIWHIRDIVKNKFLATILLKFSDKAICISKFVYFQVPCPLSKKVLVHNGIDHLVWSPYIANESLRKELSLNLDALLVGHIGQFIPWKRHGDLILAANKIVQSYQNIHFVIVGDDLFNENKKYVETIKTSIFEKGLERYFTFLGYVKDSRKILNQIDILMHTAIEEPFGRVILEAMSMGKPVVGYKSGGLEELIAHEKTGLLAPPGKAELLANQVIGLLKDKGKREGMGLRGRKEVESRFKIQESVAQIERIIDNI